ncbi:MAG TPA: hypothetical protein VGA50_04815 [Kiloniellales bacterium]
MSWIPTHSGHWVELGRLKPADVDLADIAWHLSALARFTGATEPSGYSVAEHSVRVKEAVEKAGGGRTAQAQALLHDAAETYLGDVAAPLKALLDTYRALEAQAHGAIMARFGLPFDLLPEVVEADRRMFATEWRDLMVKAAANPPAGFDPQVDADRPAPAPYDDVRLLAPWSFASARATFLGIAEQLELR